MYNNGFNELIIFFPYTCQEKVSLLQIQKLSWVMMASHPVCSHSGRADPFGLVEGKGRQPGLMTAASPWRSLPALVAPPPGLTHVGGNGEERSQAKLGALLRGHDQLFTF